MSVKCLNSETFTAQIRDSLIEKDGTSKEEKFQVSFNFGVRKLIKEKMIPLEINSRCKCYQ